jgi:flagellar basal body-associated protein FliL
MREHWSPEADPPPPRRRSTWIVLVVAVLAALIAGGIYLARANAAETPVPGRVSVDETK